MSTRNDGGQAFPMHERDDALVGMSLRNYFAGQALPALIKAVSDAGGEWNPAAAAGLAYEFADAMLQKQDGGQ